MIFDDSSIESVVKDSPSQLGCGNELMDTFLAPCVNRRLAQSDEWDWEDLSIESEEEEKAPISSALGQTCEP